MEILTPIKAIRKKCLDCCGGSAYEVSMCNSLSCSLWAYRFGVRPTTAQKNILIAKTPSRLMVLENLRVSEEEGV